MANVDLLKEKIKDSGIPLSVIARRTGIQRQSLYNKLNNKSEFKLGDIQALSSVLNFSADERDAIFFADKV